MPPSHPALRLNWCKLALLSATIVLRRSRSLGASGAGTETTVPLIAIAHRRSLSATTNKLSAPPPTTAASCRLPSSSGHARLCTPFPAFSNPWPSFNAHTLQSTKSAGGRRVAPALPRPSQISHEMITGGRGVHSALAVPLGSSVASRRLPSTSDTLEQRRGACRTSSSSFLVPRSFVPGAPASAISQRGKGGHPAPLHPSRPRDRSPFLLSTANDKGWIPTSRPSLRLDSAPELSINQQRREPGAHPAPPRPSRRSDCAPALVINQQ